jgi:hypothetical protein
MGRLLVWAVREKENKRWAGLKMVRVGCLVYFFNSFSLISFQTFTQNLFKIFKPTFDHTINSKTMHST